MANIGTPAKRVSLACRWWPNIECWLCSFVIFQEIRTSIAKKHFIFVNFQGRSGPPAPSPPLWIRTCSPYCVFLPLTLIYVLCHAEDKIWRSEIWFIFIEKTIGKLLGNLVCWSFYWNNVQICLIETVHWNYIIVEQLACAENNAKKMEIFCLFIPVHAS